MIALSTLQSKISVFIQLPSLYILQTIYALHDTAMIKTPIFGVSFCCTIRFVNVRTMQRVMANSCIMLCISSLSYCIQNSSSSLFALMIHLYAVEDQVLRFFHLDMGNVACWKVFLCLVTTRFLAYIYNYYHNCNPPHLSYRKK